MVLRYEYQQRCQEPASAVAQIFPGNLNKHSVIYNYGQTSTSMETY